MLIKPNEPLAGHTTFKIGGRAALFAEPENLYEVKELIGQAREKSQPFFILGAGSNLLVRDEGFDGIVISTRRLNRISRTDKYVLAESGALVSQILKFGVKYNLAGLEFLAGIPGSLGGVLLMNTGIKERSVSEVVAGIKALDENLEEVELIAAEASFSYRSSNLARFPFIVSASLEAKPVERNDEIKQKINAHISGRNNSQPGGYPSAGSIFKNPIGEAAGRLIESAGCKGWRQGGAVVSDKHANFILNVDNATAADVLGLIAKIREAVYDKFSVNLELEIKII
ncbi:MAG: UDP-N-acetylmuramate dehydrogenase [Candidatus Omnitrophota bacterium]|nr:UDP-N-acetylmuramate dehydrogenase [Candidatus Omnitrophota bacterium]